MPTFKITTPDGQTLRINGPDGSTQEQALQQAKAYFYEQKAQKYANDPAAKTDPTAKMNQVQKFFAGMGKSVYDTGRGIGNLVGIVSDDELRQARELDAPLMESGSALAGNIAGHIGQVLAPGGLLAGAGKAAGSARAVNLGRELMAPTSFKTGAAVGAGYNFLQPGTTNERLASAALGGLGGGVGGYIGGKLGVKRPVAKPVATVSVSGKPTATATGGGYTFGTVADDAGSLSAGQKAAEAAGKKIGFRTTPGQSSGSRALQQMEAKLESQPMTSAPFNKIKQHNQTTLNRIAAKSIGEKSDDLSAPVLEQAKDRISGMYKLVADDRARKIDADAFLDVLDAIDDEGVLAESIMDDKLVSRLFRLAEKGEATGQQLQNLTSKIGNKAASQMTSRTGDRALGIALFKVKNHVDDLLSDGLDDATKAAFTEARNQYRNLMLLTQRNGVINPSSGDIAGNALAGLLQQKDRAGFLFNKNQTDLYNAARFAQAFRPIVGDSGTATRSALPGAMDLALAAPFNVASNAYLAYPNLVTYGAQGAARSVPMMGLLGGGAVGRELY